MGLYLNFNIFSIAQATRGSVQKGFAAQKLWKPLAYYNAHFEH